MPGRIEDYAFIGDTRTGGLVGRDGSIDWLCLPRFDAGACFAALLGDQRHGRWLLTPVGTVKRTRRRYRESTLILETELTTEEGTVRLVDCMPPDEDIPNVVRIVEGVEGRVPMRMELTIRFDYGRIVPWVRNVDGALLAIGGPDALALRTPIATRGDDLATVAEFTVTAGERVPFVLTWHDSRDPVPAPQDGVKAIADAEAWWREWATRCEHQGPWREEVMSSLTVLKGLTYTPTGAIVAAPTTSLPELIGGVRNWDYRFCWMRDATFILYAMMMTGFKDEARAFRDWMLRAVAGVPSQLQAVYGVGGERRLPELVLDWLPGYEGSRPVRVGNAACSQFQLDIYGEVLDTLFHARRAGLPADSDAWALSRKLLDFLETAWREPDEGIWEIRGPRRHFTHSKVMAWVAFDRAVKGVEHFGLEGPAERWGRIRDELHAEISRRAWSPKRNSFVQAFDSENLDASLLLLPLVGFVSPRDSRMIATVAAIERDLLHDGFVRRYLTDQLDDGLPSGEGVFLACSFWLADNYALMGREADARALFERLLALRNDVGLLAEEYDPVNRRLLGNFPQAFSHVGVVNTACSLTPSEPTPASERRKG